MKRYIFLLGLLCANPLLANGDWQVQGELGIIKTSGNTDNEKINLGLSAKKKFTVWENDFALKYYQSENEGQTDADNIQLVYKLSRDITQRIQGFVELSYLDDDFDGFTQQYSAGAGLSYLFLENDKMQWKLGVGAGYRDTSELSLVNGVEVEGEDLSNATFLFRSDFQYQITSNTQLVDTFKADIGSSNSFFENEVGLSVSMNSRFALKAAYLVRHNTDPAPNSEETDTITSINLVYTLGK